MLELWKEIPTGSPDLAVYGYDAYYVNGDGNVNYGSGVDLGSYGNANSSDFDNLDYSAYHVEMDGSILGNWYVTGSYGNHASPETIDDNDAYYIYTSGVVVLDDYTSNSYGKLSGYTLYYFLVGWFKRCG